MAEVEPRRFVALRSARAIFADIPGMPTLLACFALLIAWHFLARLVAIDSLASPWSALKEVPAILGDREALLNILDSVRRMGTGFVLALLFAVPVGLMMGRSRAVAAFVNPLMMVSIRSPRPR